jgi:hypothetical protein
MGREIEGGLSGGFPKVQVRAEFQIENRAKKSPRQSFWRRCLGWWKEGCLNWVRAVL